MPQEKKKFVSLFFEFLSVLIVDVPKVFFNASPVYRAMRRSYLSKNSIDRGMRNFYYRGYLTKQDSGYILTVKGKQWVKKSKSRYYKLYQKTWDRKWRIILFDIPSGLERKRHSLRSKLKSINAYMMQKSVFVFPYPCEEEIGAWCQYLGLSDHVDVIIADHIGSKEPFAKEHFNLK